MFYEKILSKSFLEAVNPFIEDYAKNICKKIFHLQYTIIDCKYFILEMRWLAVDYFHRYVPLMSTAVAINPKNIPVLVISCED